MERVSPSERLRRELEEVLAGVGHEQDPIEVIGRLGARLILQQALEAEVDQALGRARYERSDEVVAYRNGYEPKTVKTTGGPMVLERPRIRNAGELGFASRILGQTVTRTHALEALVISGFLRGLSVRDVEAMLAETFDTHVVGKSTVSRICDDIRTRYTTWCGRSLADYDVVYLFLDAVYLRMRPTDEPAEGVLVAWGMTVDGRKVLLGLRLGSRESYTDWLDFARDLTRRGLDCPTLVCADGAPGIWKAVSEAWPAALGQRCTVHKLRNLLAKLPERLHAEVKARYWAALDDTAAPAQASQALAALAADYQRAYPSFATCLHDDLDQLVTHLSFPSQHRKRIRTSNVLERAFVEVRRRTKIIGRLPGETSALSLVWGVLELSSRNWRGVTMTPRAAAHIERIRRDLTPPRPHSQHKEVAAA
jgi:putative transposase